MNEKEPEKITIDRIKNEFLSKYPNLTVLLKLGSKGSAILKGNLHVETHSVGIYND